ncbi:hypothetical protein EGW08_020493, partial [Elysia chlorotica]
YKQERNWALSLLAEGLRDTSDYWLYQKKSVFKIILSFYGSALSDKTSQALVLSVVKAACMEKTVAVHLVKDQGLLTWLSSAVDGLASRPEHCDALCEIVHALWTSLSTHRYHKEEGRSVEEITEGDGDEQEKEKEAAGNDSSDMDEVSSDDDDDNDDEDTVEETDESDDSDNQTVSSDRTGKSKKRKIPSNQGVNKKQKLSDSYDEGIQDKSLKKTKKDSESDSEAMSSDEDNTEILNGVQSGTKSLKLERSKQVKRGTRPSMPKSTVAELGLLVRGLVWHLSTTSIKNVGKLLEVHRGLIDLMHQSSVSQHGPSATNTSTEQDKLIHDQQSSLSGAEACLILHRLGSTAQIPQLVSAVETELVRLGVDVKSTVCRSIQGNNGIKSIGKLNSEEAKGAEEPLEVEDLKQSSQTGQGEEDDEGKVGPGLQSADEGGETLQFPNDSTDLESKELARTLLISTREIFTLTQSVEFV